MKCSQNILLYEEVTRLEDTINSLNKNWGMFAIMAYWTKHVKIDQSLSLAENVTCDMDTIKACKLPYTCPMLLRNVM